VPLSKAAGDKGATLLAAVTLSRTPSPGQAVPPALTAKVFDAKVGDVVQTSDASGGYVAQLKEVQTPEKAPDEVAASLSGQIANDSRADITGQFTQALRRRFTVEIKRDALDKMF